MHVHPLIHTELSRQRGLELRAQRPARRNRSAHEITAGTVRAAVAGEAGAWEELVGTFGPIVRRVVLGYRLRPTDVDDVLQATWESAFTHIAKLRDADAVCGWLCVIARREALRTLRRQSREIAVDNESLPVGADETTPETGLVEQERARAVNGAISRLPEHQRALVVTMLHDSERSYSDVARDLGMPIGSIGPTRGRALARLRRDRELRSLSMASERVAS